MLDLGLDGKIAIITGGSDGLGRAAAERLAREGARVAICGRRKDRLEQAADGIRKATGGQILAQVADVSRAADVEALVAATVAQFGGLDILVNNAGTNPYFGPMADIEPAAAAKTVEVNQFAVVQWTRLALRASMAERGGAIVNIASVGGLVTELGIGYYNATKAAVIHLSKQFAMELAPKVRVNCIAPGLVKTHLARALWEPNEAEISKHMPLGRLGEPEDIANAAVFLAGDASSWMTGQTLVVDGGATIRPSVA